MTSALPGRIAGAPISWGVCEVPGWGHQMQRERVLGEMRSIGLTATELGPVGFLPEDPQERSALLEQHGLAGIGGFLPLVLHDGFDPSNVVTRVLSEFALSGGMTLVLAAATGCDGYDDRPTLTVDEWQALLGALDVVHGLAEELGVRAVLHPHVGTVIETAEEVERVLSDSDINLCLDTGHLLIGGCDPLELVKGAPRRVGHVHLKDVRSDLAAQVRAGETTYSAAVRDGLYPVLGRGDVDVTGVVSVLESDGYAGWYVLEQDVVLEQDPAPGQGPVGDVRHALHYLLTSEA